MEEELRTLEQGMTRSVLEEIAGQYRETIARNPGDRMISERYTRLLRDLWRARRRPGAE